MTTDAKDWTQVLTCSQCGQPLAARACGPTHAVVKADPTRHVNYPNLDTR